MADITYLLSRELVMGEVLARHARRTPEKTAIVFEDKVFNYRQFNERVNRLSHALLKEGVEPGDKVAFDLYNSNEIMECYFAAFKTGAIAVPMNYRLAPAEMSYLLENSEAKVFIYDVDLENAQSGIDWSKTLVKRKVCVGQDGDYESWLEGQNTAEPLILLKDTDPAVIMYTAGTTGRSKGAVLTHKNLYVQTTNWICVNHIFQEDCWYAPSPLFHIAALAGVLPHVFMGAKNVLTRLYRPLEALQLIEREQVTGIVLIPTMWIDFLQLKELDDYDTASLRLCGSGGAILPVEVKKKIIARWGGYMEAFGQTEMSPCVTQLLTGDAVRKTTSVGRSALNVEIRVVDHKGQDVALGEVGEAVYRGPTTMLEYYRAPEKTEEAMQDGWFHSGDLVRMDEEGFVYVAGRKKDMIISGGENIYPAEIEEILYEEPRILEAAVIGLPDPRWGENVVAVIKLQKDASMTEQEVIDICIKKLAGYKKPKQVIFTDELIKSAAGKILKNRIREHYANEQGLSEP